MKTMIALTTVFSSMITAAVLFTAPGARATDEFTSTEISAAETEALLNFRIEEPAGRLSLADCIKDLKRMREERLLDPQLPAHDAMDKFDLLNLTACTETEGTVPLSYPYVKGLTRSTVL